MRISPRNRAIKIAKKAAIMVVIMVMIISGIMTMLMMMKKIIDSANPSSPIIKKSVISEIEEPKNLQLLGLFIKQIS